LAARLRERLLAASQPAPAWLLAAGLLLAALLLRMAPLGRYVTPDEPAWVHRSIRFSDALATGDWAAVPVTGHPGVTTMWLGSVGVLASRLTAPAESAEHLRWIRLLPWLAPENGEAFRHLAFFLSWARIAVTLTTTVGLGLAYVMMRRLFRQPVPIIALGLLALDPYLAGHSGLLHTDGLLATFSLLALVSIVSALREPGPALWWALAGLFAALAALTKGPGLVVMAFVLAGMALGALQAAHRTAAEVRQVSSGPSRPQLIRIVRYLMSNLPVCLGAFGLAIWILYPALWQDPIEVVRTVTRLASGEVASPVTSMFFMGRTSYDPGPGFYPIALLVRSSPLVLIGAAIGVARLRHIPLRHRVTVLWLAAFVLIWGGAISLGTKKYDRYLLPLLPPLAVIAALGIGDMLTHRPGRVLLVQLVLTLPFLRYPLAYASPLAGGPWGAARMISVDWGEGMGAAARHLNGRTDAGRLTVAALSVPSFAPLFVGRTVDLDHAYLADYVVTGPSQLAPHLELMSTERIAFTDRTATYTNTAPLEQASYLAQHASAGDLILLDAQTPLARHYDGPGTIVSVAEAADRGAIADRVLGLAPRGTVWLVSSPVASPVTAHLVGSVLDSAGTVTSGETVGTAFITHYRWDGAVGSPSSPSVATFGEYLQLVVALLPEAPIRAPFPVFLRWRAQQPSPTALHASLYLRDEDGHLLAEVGQLVVNGTTFPTSAWTEGEWADAEMSVKLPSRILPGRYSVEATVTDSGGTGRQLGAWDENDQFLGVRVHLGDVRVLPPEHPQGPPPCTAERTFSYGPLLACADEPVPPTVFSGDSVAIPLTWSMVGTPRNDLKVRWRLLDEPGIPVREQMVDLAAYAASSWRAGDSYKVFYDWRIDPELGAGTYNLALNVLAPDGTALGPVDGILSAVRVLARERRFDLPRDISHLLDLTLGQVVQLRGFDVALPASVQGSGGTALQPGDEIGLTLYWQADGPTDLDYSVFVHLVGPDGKVHGQVDRVPAAGDAPTTSWAPGQVVVDEVVLPVTADAPAGLYHIAVGLYDAASGGRLPITDSFDQRLPDDQAFLPVAFTVDRRTR
jgi:4-amino-4-deoxy-L-arabinose transferase-like glycosyltransferase